MENTHFLAKDSGLMTEPAKTHGTAFREGAARTQSLYASPPTLKADSIPSAEDGYAPAATGVATTSLVSPPTSHSDDVDNVSVSDIRNSTLTAPSPPRRASVSSRSRETVRRPKDPSQLSPITKEEVSEVNDTRSFDTSTELTSQAMIDPPSAGHVNPGRTVHRQGRTTPSDGNQATDKHGRERSSSLASPSQQLKSEERDRASVTETDADSESLRLIRELQEQEFSLRTRGTRR